MPVWFALDGDDIMLTTGANRVNGRNLRRDGRVCLSVDDPAPPFSFVTIEGEATVIEEPNELLRWVPSIGGRYMGADRAEEFGKRNGVPGELVVRIRPTRIVAELDMTS